MVSGLVYLTVMGRVEKTMPGEAGVQLFGAMFSVHGWGASPYGCSQICQLSLLLGHGRIVLPAQVKSRLAM